MAKKVLVKDNKVLSLHSGKVLGAPENYDLDTYLNFYMPFGGTITLRRIGSPTVVELEYSTDGGRTWHIWEEVGTDRTVELPQEGRVWIRNTSETSTGFSTSTSDYYQFVCSKHIILYGQINSLLCKNPQNSVVSNYCFRSLFYDCRGVIKLPLFPPSSSGHFMQGCFGRTSITDADIQTEGVLSTLAFNNMFYQCAMLNKIVLRVSGLGTNALAGWVLGVGSTGDFYCPAELTLSTGGNGIPSGWTRHDLSEL